MDKNAMNPYDLAWKGVTIGQKRDLLRHSLAERDRLLKEGKPKDAYLGLGSTCVDIIGTSKAVLKEMTDGHDAAARAEWQSLLDDGLSIAKEAVVLAERSGREDWTANDHEVAGTIVLRTSNGIRNDVDHAIALLKEGASKAESKGNVSDRALILAQLVRGSVATGETASVESSIRVLHGAIGKARELDPKVSTRLYRALAEGSKFLAIQYAKKAGSENQELKAKNI